MALIACPDCQTQVSDQAPSCPKCSRPMKATTIEATGKKWKTFQLVGGMLVLGGCVATMSGEDAALFGVVFFIVGIGALVTGSLGGWWQHG